MRRWWAATLVSISFFAHALAYTVPLKDDDYSRQTCSGMWAGPDTAIEVGFDAKSQGQVAMVIYEWKDVEYLGKVTSQVDETLPPEYIERTYVCTSDAARNGFCDVSHLGLFILDLPNGKSINDTSFYSAKIKFSNSTGRGDVSSGVVGRPPTGSDGNGFWNNPAGNPVLPEGNEHTSPWKRASAKFRVGKAGAHRPVHPRAAPVFDNASPSGTLIYSEPIHYHVHKTGYYCVAVVPVTVLSNTTSDTTDVPFHPSYSGTIIFQNTFKGQLPATDYPKVNFYLVMFMVYAILGGVWGSLCYKHREDILPIQYYVSGLVGFLIVEMVANWVYYRYLNAHGKGTGATAFLFVVAILDAGRNALSFFMLLVVSMGLSVVRESLGGTMLRCQILTGAHFIFGVLYAVGVVELELESTSALVLLLFVIPLAFTLSGFLLWILYSLNGTITELQVRKQRYKLTMFTRLYRILWLAVLLIGIFFVVSTLSFSSRLAEDYAANSWKSRWWLLDGWLSLLYLAAFWSIAYIWRPTGSNRYLAMSDELAQDEPDAEDYDMANLEQRVGQPRGPAHPDDDDEEDDAATLVGGRRGASVRDETVFEIGDEDGDEEEERKRLRRLSGEGERQGLMGRKDE